MRNNFLVDIFRLSRYDQPRDLKGRFASNKKEIPVVFVGDLREAMFNREHVYVRGGETKNS